MSSAARCSSRRPVSVPPVKLIFLTAGWDASQAPTVGPGPFTELSTPAGRPASRAPATRAEDGQEGSPRPVWRRRCSPAARAGASFQAIMPEGVVPGPDGRHYAHGLLYDHTAQSGRCRRHGLAINSLRLRRVIVESIRGRLYFARSFTGRLALFEGQRPRKLRPVCPDPARLWRPGARSASSPVGQPTGRRPWPRPTRPRRRSASSATGAHPTTSCVAGSTTGAISRSPDRPANSAPIVNTASISGLVPLSAVAAIGLSLAVIASRHCWPVHGWASRRWATLSFHKSG